MAKKFFVGHNLRKAPAGCQEQLQTSYYPGASRFISDRRTIGGRNEIFTDVEDWETTLRKNFFKDTVTLVQN